MRKIISLAIVAIISLAVFAGCAQNSGNDAASVFQPIIGTWSVTTLGIPTTLVFNSDSSMVETTTVLGISSTKTGIWNSNDKTITRTWSDGSVDVKYYTFADNNKLMVLSSSPDGVATTYNRI